MIWYMVTKRHSYTLGTYLKTWGQPLAERFGIVTYESLRALPEFNALAETYIFSDIERLGPPDAAHAARARKRILEQVPDARILNHPTRSMRRYELLRKLFESGDNAFNVYRLVECRQPQRWPVFIREENEHNKILTGLLHTPEELEAAVADILARGDSREDKLIVEFCDTRDDQGLFYVYTACLIGERMIPGYRLASREWVVGSRNALRTPELLEKERRYQETNPYERELREIFRLARIDYGKIDYAILGDRLQVWEINTNPNVFASPDFNLFASADQADVDRKAELSEYAEHVAAAFAEIDVQDAPYEPGPKASYSL